MNPTILDFKINKQNKQTKTKKKKKKQPNQQTKQNKTKQKKKKWSQGEASDAQKMYDHVQKEFLQHLHSSMADG